MREIPFQTKSFSIKYKSLPQLRWMQMFLLQTYRASGPSCPSCLGEGDTDNSLGNQVKALLYSFDCISLTHRQLLTPFLCFHTSSIFYILTSFRAYPLFLFSFVHFSDLPEDIHSSALQWPTYSSTIHRTEFIPKKFPGVYFTHYWKKKKSYFSL